MNHYEAYLDTLRRDLIDPLSEHIVFEKGLTWEEQRELEEFWGIRFPKSLTDFYVCAFPAAERNPVVYPWSGPQQFSRFPDWRDCSAKNEKHIRELLETPVEYLVHELKRDNWICDNWRGLTPEEVGEAAPKLIPVYVHRYIPQNGFNPPVFSAVGRDVVYYGSDLFDWLRREFLTPVPEVSSPTVNPYVPVWGDIPRQIFKKISDNVFPSAERFLEFFTENPRFLGEFGFRFASDPISPKQPGFCRERMIGWSKEWARPFWIGGCDIDGGADFPSAEELINAPVFSGRSMKDRWNEVIWLELNGIDPHEWAELHFPK